jgi:hypothetical protein
VVEAHSPVCFTEPLKRLKITSGNAEKLLLRVAISAEQQVAIARRINDRSRNKVVTADISGRVLLATASAPMFTDISNRTSTP